MHWRWEIYDKDSITTDDINKAKEVALEYYQIQQFKRAHFECIEVDYSEVTGKVNKLSFEFKGKFN